MTNILVFDALIREAGARPWRVLQIFNLLKPHILWLVIVIIAIYDFFHPSDVMGLIGFLVLMATAAGSLSLPQAIDLLRGKPLSVNTSSPPEEKEIKSQLGEKATEDQDEPM